MQELVTLNLQNLAEGLPALTGAMGSVLAEAAAVCLEDRGHTDSVQLHVRRIETPQFLLSYPTVTEAMRRTHNDLERATEHGACGVAILLIGRMTGLTVIKQSKKGTGFDYWLGSDDGEESLPFQSSARLEVSGILNGTDSQFATRIKQKLKQTQASDSTKLTAYAVVVEFGQPQAEVGER
ncbi:hypothetical protein [Gimesia algae]|uniref:Uncharacterized protein n=1 Tax=Gimesia algae TaxID=2527971 RepID=A0A517VFL5_9PLAN|nr:hypothetical protein [Gimesia algae]QDT91747.1 hypothetical protein Pan161_34100 [Gimesia algae]